MSFTALRPRASVVTTGTSSLIDNASRTASMVWYICPPKRLTATTKGTLRLSK